MLKVNNKIIKVNNKWLNAQLPPAPPPVFTEVQIGNQIWSGENLSIDDGLGGVYIRYNVTANGVNYGTQYYYTSEAADRIVNSIPGWHLPSYNDLVTLCDYIDWDYGGKKIKSTSGWNDNGNGTDDYGFNATPIGYYTIDIPPTPVNCGDGLWVFYITSYDSNSGRFVYGAQYYSDSVANNQMTPDSDLLYAHAVRLIKDT